MGFLVMSMNEVVQAAWDAKLISGYNVEYVNVDALMRFAEEISRVLLKTIRKGYLRKISNDSLSWYTYHPKISFRNIRR